MLVCCIFGLTLAYVRTCINIHDLFRSCILMQLAYSLYSLHFILVAIMCMLQHACVYKFE